MQKALLLDHGEKYTCKIHLYNPNHRVLRIQAKYERMLYIYFTEVVYFSGPLSWTGANFLIDSPENCTALLKRSGLAHDLSEEELTYKFTLYSVPLEEMHLQIIAMNLSIRWDNPS